MTPQQSNSIEKERVEAVKEFLSRFLQRFLFDITEPKIVLHMSSLVSNTETKAGGNCSTNCPYGQ
jgi:hypothetical protein